MLPSPRVAIISSLGGLHCATTSQVWEGQTQHNLALSVGLYVLCVEPIFYQLLRLGCTGPTFPYPRAMVRTIIFGKNAHNSPLSEATKRRWKLGCQRRSPKNAIGITCGHRNTTMNVCTPLGSKPRGRMGSKCIIFHFANKPGRPQHNTQHNGIS